MIARHWRGWTEPHNADAYEHLLKDTVLPGLRQIEGYRLRQIEGYQGGYVLRNNLQATEVSPAEVEFVVINLFDSLDSVKRFAGPEYEIAVFEPEARRLLSRVEPTARHYQVAVSSI